MEPDLTQGEPEDSVGTRQLPRDQKGAHCLRDQCGDSRPCHSHMEAEHKQDIQYDIDTAAHDQIIERSFRVTCGAQDSGAHIVDQHKNNACKVDSQIDDRICENVFRSVHQPEHCRRQRDPEHCEQCAGCESKGAGVVQALVRCFIVLRSEELGDGDRGAGGQPGEEADYQGDDLGRRPAYAGKRLFPHKLSHDDRIDGVIKLLKKCPDQDREEKKKKLFPDDSVSDRIFLCLCVHICKPPCLMYLLSYKNKSNLL